MEPLVSTAWLADALGAGDLRIVDADLFLPEHKRDAAAEFAAGHIPGAVFLDLARFADPDDPLPSMMPPADVAAERLGALGIGASDRIVVYDDSPVRSAARAWWVLKRLGAPNVAILDGGLDKWRAEGRPLAAGAAAAAAPATFRPRPELSPVRDLAAMTANLSSRAEQVVDARGPARFAGAEPEARPGVVPGHIPGSVNLPYARFFEDDGTWKRGDAIARAFADAGVDLDRPIVTTCGSGVTAAVLVFALQLIGRDAALYDGSWSEWGADPATPKATA